MKGGDLIVDFLLCRLLVVDAPETVVIPTEITLDGVVGQKATRSIGASGKLDLDRSSLLTMSNELTKILCSPKKRCGSTESKSDGANDRAFTAAIGTDDNVQMGARFNFTVIVGHKIDHLDPPDTPS